MIDRKTAPATALPYTLSSPPVFRFKHEIKPSEKPYDYYFSHPKHRQRPLTARQVRRRRIREG